MQSPRLAAGPLWPVLLLAIVPSLLVSSRVSAQEPDVTFGPPSTATVPVQVVPPDYFAPDVPQPPRSLQNRESAHAHPVLPVGPPNNVPQPQARPTDVVDPARLDAGSFVFFQNQLVNSSSGQRSPRTPEPASATLRDTVIQTGNWHAAISPDNGETWTDVSPYTFFPTANGGFCCDQQAIDVPSHGIAVWMLQYGEDSSANNRLRFAIANSRDKLRSGQSSDWYYYDLSAQFFGYPSGRWLDYDDLAFDGDWLYCRTNVINASESIVFRISLTNLANRQGAGVEWYTSATIGGWSHRLAKGTSGGLMAFAALKNTSEIYVWTWPTTAGAAATRSTRSIASFVDSGASAAGPDGRNWAGFWNATGQIQGAYGNATECGFSWGCSATTGRAYAYTRVARFRLSDRALIGETDIFNGNGAFLYGDMMSNAAGDVGGVIAYGGASTYVTVGNYIIDSYDAWPPNTVYLQAGGSSGPNVNRFGDYFTVRRHPIATNTWISNGSSCPDPNTGNHRFVWFGRDDNTPTWVTLDVQDAGLPSLSSAAITVDVTDLDGAKDGSTNFTRRFAPRQGYTLTAPSSVTYLRTVYVFDRWSMRITPTSSFVDQPVGERVLAVSDIGGLDDTCIANYKIRRTLSIQSTNPSSGVTITVTPADLNGRLDGATAFSRVYRDGEVVTVTAPANVGYNLFRRWVVDGVAMGAGATMISIPVTSSRTAVAEFWNNVAGSATAFGTGCVGSNGLVPSHYATWPSGQQGVQQGSPTYYRLRYARPNAGVALNFGLSASNWGAFPLPLDLGFIGITGCRFYHDYVVSESVATNASGNAVFTVVWPLDRAAIGGHVYTSYVVIDPGAPRSLPLTYSNAVDTVQGGNQ